MRNSSLKTLFFWVYHILHVLLDFLNVFNSTNSLEYLALVHTMTTLLSTLPIPIEYRHVRFVVECK